LETSLEVEAVSEEAEVEALEEEKDPIFVLN
jgi:hypothetical protein